MRHLVITLLFAAASASQAQADRVIPTRTVSAAEATSKDTVGFLYGVRQLADGRLLVNDAGNRRLLLLDRTLQASRVVADSGSGAAMSYGKRPTNMIGYAGDSTLLVDLAARAFLVVEPSGRIGRVMSAPRPNDVAYMGSAAMGVPGLDAGGRIVYRGMLMPAFKAPEPGKPFEPPVMPDSSPILQGDFDRRTADTVAWIRTPKMRVTTEYLPGGGVRMSTMINPVSSIDDWTIMSDGTIAIVRGQDYHVDFIGADGKRMSSPKLPFEWKRISDEEKVAIVDSTRIALARQQASGQTQTMALTVGGHGTTAMAPHSMTILPGNADGAPPRAEPPAPAAPQVVPANELPDYWPPILKSGTTKADADGNIWILPTTTSKPGDGLLYDVVNRLGELAYRVRLPAGRALEGFGPNGTIYLSSHEAGGARIERVRLAAPPAAGLSFIVTSAVTLPQRLEAMTTPMFLRGRGLSLNGKTRVDIESAENAGGIVAEGDYLLASSLDGITHVGHGGHGHGPFHGFIQNPLAAMHAAMGGPVATDVTSHLEKLGKGDPIEGRPTEHYRITAHYAMNAGHPLDASVVIHVWTAELPAKITNPFLAFGGLSTGGMSAFGRELLDAFREIKTGTPVKVVSTTTLDANGQKMDVVQTTAITEIKPADVDPAKLTVPR